MKLSGVPVYVAGKGMFATLATTSFKTGVMHILEKSGLGYDTRMAYYAKQYPELTFERLSRMICDPIEYYDRDWPEYQKQHAGTANPDMLAVDFFLPRDQQFRERAVGGIIGFHEAGLGTGINCMRFLLGGKPILGFLPLEDNLAVNRDNIFQLVREYPELFTLIRETDCIETAIADWIVSLQSKAFTTTRT
ncbi:MAG: hypothetical protein D6698_06530 [Gammaproteobacteria bacterium]|nr:MAG: hypothetical protein D6698_06530 [Gammaproteobacteria bacterium]